MIIRYQATKIKEHDMIPMFYFDGDELELKLRRLKDGDESVRDTMAWISRYAGDKHWEILASIVETRRLPIDPTYDNFNKFTEGNDLELKDD